MEMLLVIHGTMERSRDVLLIYFIRLIKLVLLLKALKL